MTEEQINTLLDTQRMLLKRQAQIARLAEDYIKLCGTGVMVRDVRNAFLVISNIASGRGDTEVS